jgi:hypothetical protein
MGVRTVPSFLSHRGWLAGDLRLSTWTNSVPMPGRLFSCLRTLGRRIRYRSVCTIFDQSIRCARGRIENLCRSSVGRRAGEGRVDGNDVSAWCATYPATREIASRASVVAPLQISFFEIFVVPARRSANRMGNSAIPPGGLSAPTRRVI